MITNVNLDVTTFCDRACPQCCCATNGKMFRPKVHHPWSYFVEASRWIYGIERVNLTGGEPTFHPQFGEFVPRFKGLFGCQKLTMITDGWGTIKYRSVIGAFIDGIEYTEYHTGKGGSIADIRDNLFVHVSTFDAGAATEHHVRRSRRGSGRPCIRAVWRGGTVAYADGKLWGCCVAPGIEGAEGITPYEGWREEVISAPLPCAECWFSE